MKVVDKASDERESNFKLEFRKLHNKRNSPLRSATLLRV